MIIKANINQAKKIQEIIGSAAKKDQVLERSLNYIYENIRDFWLYIENEKIIGCCSLHVIGWQSLAEVKSLVVQEEHQGKGAGTRLVWKALEEAKALGASKVFALTFAKEFFKKLGFRLIDKSSLPHKIWTECLNCKYFPDCKEEAVIIEV